MSALPSTVASTSHLIELTLAAFHDAREAASAAADVLTSSSADSVKQIQLRERNLDSIDRDLDDLVTSTIARVPEANARELLACMKIVISLERMGDLLLNVANRGETVSVKLHSDDVKDLITMAVRLESMIAGAEKAFVNRSIDEAITVLRADGEMDRLRNLIFFRHLEQNGAESRLSSFHVLFMAQELERSGDHAKNIAEEVCHLVSGRTVRHVLRSYDRPIEQMYLEHLREQR